jgi:hypothetical protein
MQATPKSRPTGVTIIAILNVIGGIIMLFFGLAFVALGAIIPFVPQSELQQQQQNLTAGDIDLSQVPPSLIGGAIIAVGGVLSCNRHFLICGCLWIIKRKALGLDTDRNSVNHKHCSSCNLDCYYWRYL